MKHFDPSRLAPGEIVFALHTNGTVDAGRFADFLAAFSETVVAAPLPPVKFDIVELWSGSLWARLTGSLPDPDAAERDIALIEAATEGKRAIVDAGLRAAAAQERAAEAAERSANANERIAAAAEASAADGAENKRMQRKSLSVAQWALFVSVVGTAYTIADGMTAENPNPHAVRCADLMHIDGVAKIEIWTMDHHIAVTRPAVPVYQQRQQGITGFLSAVETGEDTVTATGTVGPPPYGAGPFGAGAYPGIERPPVKEWPRRVDHAEHSAPFSDTLFDASPAQLRRFIGRVEQYDDMFIFVPAPGERAHREPPMILIPPRMGGFRPSHGYEVLGRVFKTPAGYDILVAKSVSESGRLSK